MKKSTLVLLAILVLFFNSYFSFSQINSSESVDIDYSSPQKYEIGGIAISGLKYLDQTILLNITGLVVGDTISVPGEKITDAIKAFFFPIKAGIDLS